MTWMDCVGWWLVVGHGALGGHSSGLPAVPLPGLRPAVQPAQRRRAELDLLAERNDKLRDLLPSALLAEAPGFERNPLAARVHGKP
jgi:hypothetical protein